MKEKLKLKDVKEILIVIEAKKCRTGDMYFLCNAQVIPIGSEEAAYQNAKQFKGETSKKAVEQLFSYFYGEEYSKFFVKSSWLWASYVLKDFAKKYKMKYRELEFSDKPYSFYHLYK